MGIVGTAAMVSYSSWKETQIKIVEGKDIIDNYEKVRESFISYFKNPKTGKDLETPRTDIVSTVCSSFSEELVKRLKNGKLMDSEAINVATFLMDTPIENCYATLLPLKLLPEFSIDAAMKKHVLENKELVLRVREAKKAKEAYLKAKEERENKKKKLPDDIPF
jgi:hypothetical protein